MSARRFVQIMEKKTQNNSINIIKNFIWTAYYWQELFVLSLNTNNTSTLLIKPVDEVSVLAAWMFKLSELS